MTSFIKGKLQFGTILSKRTCYGLIWNGTYNDIPCVIKMIMLTTGIHYDKNEDKYKMGSGRTWSNAGRADMPPAFQVNSNEPFLHTEFCHRRSMTPHAFQHEVDTLNRLGLEGLAPRVYGYGVCDKYYAIHYGFIIMERLDCSVKDILIKRALTDAENKLVKKTINSLHEEHKMVHRDMKPSNLGAYLDTNGMIRRCYVFDCQKMLRSDHCESKRQFDHLVKKDWDIYHKHVKLNRKNKPAPAKSPTSSSSSSSS